MPTIYVDAERPDNSGDGLSPAAAKRTIAAARNIATGGSTILIKAGQFHDPVAGAFLYQPNVAAQGLIVDAYGGASDKPIWDSMTYQNPGSAGWQHVQDGVWKKTFGAWYVRRLFVASRNNGVLAGQRYIGDALRRSLPGGSNNTASNPTEAQILASLNANFRWFPGGPALGFALYVYTGSASVAPPDYFDGLALLQADGATFGSVNPVEIKNAQNIAIRNQSFQGAGITAIRLSAVNADAMDTANIAIEDCSATHLFNSGFVSKRGEQTAATKFIRDIVVRRFNVDYRTCEDEQERINGESTLSGQGDALVAEAGSLRVTFDRCEVRNPFHVGIALGSAMTNKAYAYDCAGIRCTIRFDKWTSYSRGLVAYNGTGHKYLGCVIEGQSTRSQFAGGVLVDSCVWRDSKRGTRKPGTSQWVAIEAYVYDYGGGANDERYVYNVPVDVKLWNNTVSGDYPDDFVQLNSFAHAFPVAQPTWAANSVSIVNNVVTSKLSQFALRATDGGGGAPVITQPNVANNCFFNGTAGGTRVRWNAANYSINGAPGFAANIEDDPQLSAGLRPLMGSPLLGAGQHLGYRRDADRRQRPRPPSIGSYDAARLRRALG